MGFSDLGCYGGEIATPNLDALAAGGLRFTQFYNTARCCPTRASLLTGLYPHQAGVGHMVDSKKGGPGYQNDLNRHCVTIAQVLKPAGYRNYAVGKWHVTPIAKDGSEPSRHNWPLQRGFDRYYGTIHGAGSFWDPSSLVRDNRIITCVSDPEYQPKEPYYYTDAISDHAVRFIREHAQSAADQPFFLYVAYTAAHWPMHAKESDIAKYAGRYDGGYEPIRAARWAKAKQLGLIDPKWELTPASGAWEGVRNQAFEARCMEVYAAMAEAMDHEVGRLMAHLKRTGEFDNTVFVFLSDNGPEGSDYREADLWLRMHYTRELDRLGGPGAYVVPGPQWAHVSASPLSTFKFYAGEGGIRSPLIISGAPGALPNSVHAGLTHVTDIVPTLLDLAQVAHPASRYGGEPVEAITGRSLRPVLHRVDARVRAADESEIGRAHV